MLCYHAISPTWPASLSLPPDRFERQIAFLLERGWQPQTFTDAVTGIAPGRVLAITFDDGFASIARLGRPILDRLGVPATLFVPTAFMDREPGRLSWKGIDRWVATEHAHELQSLGWEECASLAACGWEIGSHTRTHPRLTRCDDATLKRELNGSLREYEQRLGAPCRAIAYPYGDIDERVIVAAAAAGYVTGARLSSNLQVVGTHAVPRIGIYHEDHWVRFLAKVARPVRRLRTSALWRRD